MHHEYLPLSCCILWEFRVIKIEVSERISTSSAYKFKTSSMWRRHTNANIMTAWTSRHMRRPLQLVDITGSSLILPLNLKSVQIMSVISALELIAFSPALCLLKQVSVGTWLVFSRAYLSFLQSMHIAWDKNWIQWISHPLLPASSPGQVTPLICTTKPMCHCCSHFYGIGPSTIVFCRLFFGTIRVYTVTPEEQLIKNDILTFRPKSVSSFFKYLWTISHSENFFINLCSCGDSEK